MAQQPIAFNFRKGKHHLYSVIAALNAPFSFDSFDCPDITIHALHINGAPADLAKIAALRVKSDTGKYFIVGDEMQREFFYLIVENLCTATTTPPERVNFPQHDYCEQVSQTLVAMCVNAAAVNYDPLPSIVPSFRKYTTRKKLTPVAPAFRVHIVDCIEPNRIAS